MGHAMSMLRNEKQNKTQVDALCFSPEKKFFNSFRWKKIAMAQWCNW